MSDRKSLVIFISNENYLRNWIRAGAFEQLRANYELHYVVARDYWDPALLKDFGIAEYTVVEQPAYRKFLLRRLLTVTMFKHTRKSRAFSIKMRFVRPKWAWFYKFLALPAVYETFLLAVRAGLPTWAQFAQIVQRINPVAVIAPSLAADSFTIDMTYTAKKLGIKSMLLINSWDNLVSKGVLPLPPDCVGVWGQQGINQAMRVQNVPRERVVALGVPRFDRYFRQDEPKPEIDIHEFNGIPKNKKIILYAATAIPFDDISAIEILDRFISSDPAYSDYVILFRPHPEMMKRSGERAFADCHFSHVHLDRQVAAYYTSRFDKAVDSEQSYINNAELDYYPALLKAVVAVVCPPTTLGVEGAMNGAPCLMICYGDGKNTWLSPDQMCQYESVEEVLAMPGVVACHAESDLTACFAQAIRLSQDHDARHLLAEATRYVVYRDSTPYAQRLAFLVQCLVNEKPLRLSPQD
jgi:hypothetical protein